MKKLNVLFTAAALLFVLGCKNNAAPAKVENTDGSYIQVSIDNSKVTDSSRTAISAVPENVSYVVTASSTTDSETVSASSPIEQGSLIYNLQVTPGKSYKVEVTGYKNQSEVYKGSGSLSVPVSGKYGITVTVEYLTEGTGSVNLKFDVSDTSVYEIEKLVISGTGLPELDKEWEADNGTITVSASAVACGDYEVVLSFCNSSDVIVVEIPERISVRKNLSSSVWVKAGNQIYLKEVEGKQLFVLTDSLIKSIIESTVYVNAEGGSYTGGVIKAASDANAGTWAEPLLTLQEAVNRILAINDGVSEYTIYFSGTDKCKANGNLTSFEDFSFINISSNKSLNLSIIGDNVENCIINADRSASKTGRVLYAFGLGEKFNLTLKNLQITGGYLKNDGENDYTGGGIRYIGRDDASALNNNLKIYNSKIYGNTAESGAGIYCTKNVIIGNNTSIYSNTSELNGGGIYYQNLSLDNGKLIIGETAADAINIYENKAASGGGIYCDSSYLELNKANIYKNEASENGGGLYIYGSSAFVMNDGLIKENKTTVIFANKGYGGGVFIENEPNSLFDMCGGTIKQNTVSGVSGKGVYIGGAEGNCCVSKSASILDEVFLPQNVSLYVKDELSGSAGINVTYTDYNSTKKPVIMRETGVTSLITYALCSKFNILNDGGKYCLEPVSLTEGGLKTAGGVVEKGAKTSVTSYSIPTYTLELKKQRFPAGVDSTAELIIKNGDTVFQGSVSSYSLQLYMNNQIIPNVTSSTNTIELPDWLPEGTYQLLLQVNIQNVIYDKLITIEISSSVLSENAYDLNRYLTDSENKKICINSRMELTQNYNGNSYKGSRGSAIDITNDKVIYGNGSSLVTNRSNNSVIYSNDAGRTMFYVSNGANVELNNIEFSVKDDSLSGENTDALFVYATDGATVTLNYCNLKNVYQTEKITGFRVSGGAKIILNNCVVDHFADYNNGGADAYIIVIENGSYGEIYDSSFIKMGWDPAENFLDLDFCANSGGIRNNGDLKIYNSTFDGTYFQEGGALSNDHGTLYVKNTVFKNSTQYTVFGRNSGAAAKIWSGSERAEFVGCTFENNKTSDEESWKEWDANGGGALQICGNTTIIDSCTFVNNGTLCDGDKTCGGAILVWNGENSSDAELNLIFKDNGVVCDVDSYIAKYMRENTAARTGAGNNMYLWYDNNSHGTVIVGGTTYTSNKAWE